MPGNDALINCMTLQLCRITSRLPLAYIHNAVATMNSMEAGEQASARKYHTLNSNYRGNYCTVAVILHAN